jgi:hypothetical protein
MFRVAACLVLIVGTVGCATRSGTHTAGSAPAPHVQGPPSDSLAVFMDKVRAKSEQARPPSNRVRTVEASDPAMAAELLLASTQPTAANHRAVAAPVRPARILDQAHEHFSSAVVLDPTDAASWDGLARIWRDWGFPHLALPDAYRAVYHAPTRQSCITRWEPCCRRSVGAWRQGPSSSRRWRSMSVPRTR